MTLKELNDTGIKFSYQNRIIDTRLSEIDLLTAINYITKDESVSKSTTLLRQEAGRLNLDSKEDKTIYQKRKVELLSCFMPGGTFTTPQKEQITSYSKIVQLDFDNLSDKQLTTLDVFIKNQPSVVFSFVSPGGSGKKVFHLVSAESQLSLDGVDMLQKFHTAAFFTLLDLYKSNGVGTGFDEGIHDINRRCYLGHDSDCFINQDIKPLRIRFTVEEIVKQQSELTEKEMLFALYQQNAGRFELVPKNITDILDNLINWLKNNKKSITHTYDQWYRVIFALKKSLPIEIAKKYAREFSVLDPNFNEDEFNRQFERKLKNEKAPGLGTIFYLAREAGWPVPKKAPTLGRRDYFIQQLVHHSVHVRKNKLIDVLEISQNGSEWRRYSDDDDSRLRAGMLAYRFKKEDIRDELCLLCEQYDPVSEFINGIPSWDGLDRLKDLANSLNPEDIELPLKFLEYWMIGMLASIDVDENYNENVLILQGGQGDGKTRWVRRLFEEILNHTKLKPDRYFVSKAIDPQNKDDVKLLCQSFVVFYDELSNIIDSKSDVASFKNMTSMKNTTLRRAYDRHDSELIRRASIIATVNDSQFLKDPTGNRRFWVIPCRDTDQNHQVNIVQLWAQIKHYYKQGRKYWFDKEELKKLNDYNRRFESYSLEEELIQTYIHPCEDRKMTTGEIIREIEGQENKPIKCTPAYFGKLLTKHFGDRSKRTNKGTVYSVTIKREVATESKVIIKPIVDSFFSSTDFPTI